jgi:hypothetical protein
MDSDNDVRDENRQLLLRRWNFIVSGAPLSDAARLGMDPGCVSQLRTLVKLQVDRAADCTSPLFRFSQPDDVLARLLRPDGPGPTPGSSPRDEVDAIVAEENQLVLTNRWSAVRVSAVHSQCVFGLSASLVQTLQAATLSDILMAARRGLRLVKLAVGARYFFHAALNPTLHTSHRTVLAVCSTSGPY